MREYTLPPVKKKAVAPPPPPPKAKPVPKPVAPPPPKPKPVVKKESVSKKINDGVKKVIKKSYKKGTK